MRIIYTSQFKKDYKKAQKRNKDISKLKNIITIIANGESLPPKYKDHPLISNFAEHRECHIEPDWLLIYRIIGENMYLERTGTHSDLFR